MTTELELERNLTTVKAKKERKSSRTSTVPTKTKKNTSSSPEPKTTTSSIIETSRKFSDLLLEQHNNIYEVLKIIDFNKRIQRRVIFEYNQELNIKSAIKMDSLEPKEFEITKEATLFQAVSNLRVQPLQEKIQSNVGDGGWVFFLFLFIYFFY